MVDIDQLAFYIRHHKDKKGLTNQTIGSSLKHHRIEKNMTLEETSEGICSISYLSKLENNLLVPSNRYVHELKKRLKMPEAENLNININTIEKIMDVIENNGTLNQDDILLYLDQFDYRSKLIKYVYDIYEKKNSDLTVTYADLVLYSPQFTAIELKIFLYVTAFYLYESLYYKSAFSITKELLKLEFEPSIFLLKAKKLHLMSMFKTGKNHKIDKKYYELIQDLIDKQMFDDIMDVQKKHLIYKTYYVSVLKLDEELHNIFKIKEDEKMFLKALSRYNHGLYEDALSYTKKIVNKDIEFAILHLCTLSKLELNDIILTLLPKFKAMFPSVSKKDDIILNYLTKKANKDRHLLWYLKNEIEGSLYIIEDFHFKKYLYEELKEALRIKKYYKEALQISEKLVLELKEAAKIE